MLTLDKSHIDINIHVNIIILYVDIIYLACKGVESMPSISMPAGAISLIINSICQIQLWGGAGIEIVNW